MTHLWGGSVDSDTPLSGWSMTRRVPGRKRASTQLQLRGQQSSNAAGAIPARSFTSTPSAARNEAHGRGTAKDYESGVSFVAGAGVLLSAHVWFVLVRSLDVCRNYSTVTAGRSYAHSSGSRVCSWSVVARTARRSEFNTGTNMNLLRIGNRAINMDHVTGIELNANISFYSKTERTVSGGPRLETVKGVRLTLTSTDVQEWYSGGGTTKARVLEFIGEEALQLQEWLDFNYEPGNMPVKS